MTTTTTQRIDRQKEIANTIAETVLERPTGICKHCIDNIIKIAKTKMETSKSN